MVPPGPFAELKEQLDRFGVAPELLTIEITELAVLLPPTAASAPRAAATARYPHPGIRIRLDGFGTGHSSLSLLSELRPRQ